MNADWYKIHQNHSDWCTSSMNIKESISPLSSHFTVFFLSSTSKHHQLQPLIIMNLLYITLALVTILHVFAGREGDEHLRYAFKTASQEGDQSTVKKLYKDPAINHITYALALRQSYGPILKSWGGTFKWLLKHADEEDLKETLKVTANNELGRYDQVEREKDRYGENFKSVIRKALKPLEGKGASRIEKPVEKVKPAEKADEELVMMK